MRRKGLRFPPLCPSCGGAAAVSIRIENAFEYWEDEAKREKVLGFDVPFCEACARRHADELGKSSGVDFARRLFSEPGMALGALVVGGVGLAFLRDAVAKMSLTVFALACFPLGISYWLLRQSWMRRPGDFLPARTSVTARIDFGDIASEAFEPEWLRFRVERGDYALAFRSANAERLWDPGGGEAIAARQKRAWKERRNRWLLWAAGAAVIVLSLLSWLMGWDS